MYVYINILMGGEWHDNYYVFTDLVSIAPSGQMSELVRDAYSISTAVTQWCAYGHNGNLVLKAKSKRGDAGCCRWFLLETFVFPAPLLCSLYSLVGLELLILFICLLLGLVASIQTRS